MKKIRKALTLAVVFSMIASYSYIPVVQAASLTNVSDTVSTSAPGVSADHSFTFDTAVVLGNNGYIEVEFDANYTDVTAGSVSCPAGGQAATASGNTITCPYATGLATSTANSLVIDNVTNPSAGFYDVDVRTYQSGAVLEESAKVINYVIDTVTVTAHVDSTLTFAVAGIGSGQLVNGDTTTAASTATTTPFGDLDLDQKIVGQELQVSTNASAGFQVTVTQNSDFDTAAGAIIDSFIDGSATTTPNPWTAPSGNLASSTTWGHFGVTTDDSTHVTETFGAGEYAGLTVGTPMVIMGHNGPSSVTEDERGLTRVAYSVEIDALQEAGDYETTLTYIATPTY